MPAARVLTRAAVAAASIACAPPDNPPLAGRAFSFGVFGDAPYSPTDLPRYRALLVDVERSDVQFLIHVGDLLSGSCRDEIMEARATELRALRPAVIYTPGDNEWTDCHRQRAGRFLPLERLAKVRSIYYPHPSRSLGRTPIPLDYQGQEASWREVVENARWRRGRALFATLHLVGSYNGGVDFKARTPADDSASERRMNAAMAWLDSAYAVAMRDSVRTMFLAFHANPGFGTSRGMRDGYEAFMRRLHEHAAVFPGRTVVIHGDTHDFHWDQPRFAGAKEPLPRFHRLETFGSPRIGWVRVVVDTASGAILQVQPRPVWRWVVGAGG